MTAASILALIAIALHLLGALSTLRVLMEGRSAQGTIAWIFALVTLPYVALPFYWAFGRSRYFGYLHGRGAGDLDIHRLAERVRQALAPHVVEVEQVVHGIDALERLTGLPLTGRNDVRLLVDGAATFEAIFAAIDAAQRYVLVQFFIVHDDELGRDFKRRLLARAKAGVRVRFLFDAVGCYGLPNAYLDELRQGGVEVAGFRTRRHNRFQINFRNHRKSVIADGVVGFVGGHNVGDEYLGRDPALSPWRDTHARLEGPAVLGLQLVFVEDWRWATQTIPDDLSWNPVPSAAGNMAVLALPTGPADELETCGLAFTQAISGARERCWIASPYFVPDSKVLGALQLAALRGVDVRVLLPSKVDHVLVWLSSFSWYPETAPHGVKIYRYQQGFLHQKVVLVDEGIASVSSANLDNRSFRLNFELGIVVADRAFAGEVERMLEADFACSRQVEAGELDDRSVFFRLAVRIARLFGPIL